MQQGGSGQQYGGGVPSSEMAAYTAGGAAQGAEGVLPNSNHLATTQPAAEAVAPINSRPPNTANLEELATTTVSDEGLAAAGEEAERGGAAPGNRWPRDETLALIKIRTDMDATFRDATLKGPLWDEVSRKLAAQGYTRSAKKCKEKFENVHKYYKRTKEGRAGRQDGKSYRFFAQLEALHNITSGDGAGAAKQPSSAPSFGISASGTGSHPVPLTSVAPLSAARPHPTSAPLPPPPGGFTFSFDSSSADTSETDGEQTGLKRKRGRSSDRVGERKTMAFFNELMKQLMDQQEAMQERFLEAIEKREQDRAAREEAWKRQEMARISREQEAAAQERAVSANRDSAIIALLQKITGHTIHHKPQQTLFPEPTPETTTTTTTAAAHDLGSSGDPTSSRWPKDEVHALIEIRGGMESRYQEVGPKGQLWEEISLEMRRKGFNRSSKRCKEKWENINKYFKKMKDSNRKRPEDAKTCPYFHQLEALYRRKSLAGAPPLLEPHRIQNDVLALPPPPSDTTAGDGRGTSNGDIPAEFFEEETAGAGAAKKPDEMVKELMAAGDDKDSDNIDGTGEDDDEEDEEEQKVAYKIEFQRPNVAAAAANGGGSSASQPSVASRVASSPATAGTSSFLAMVQ